MKKQFMLFALLSFGAMAMGYDEYFESALKPGAWTLGVKAGAAPTFWFGGDKAQVHIDLAKEAKLDSQLSFDFQDLFAVPVWVAPEIGYNCNEYTQIFAEFAWRHAFGRSESFSPQAAYQLGDTHGLNTINGHISDFDSFGGYAGIRFYGHQWLGSFDPYIGFKVGALHHQAIKASFDLQGVLDEKEWKVSSEHTLYSAQTVASGGVSFGFSAPITDCLSFNVGAEVIVSGAPSAVDKFDLVVNTAVDGTTISQKLPIAFKPNNAGFEVSVPVTVGLTYQY